MDDALEIDFGEALGHLQGLLGQRVRALVNVHDSFAGCVLEGELERVETLRPDDRAVNLVIAARQGIVLGPEDGEVLLVGDPARGQGALEFHLTSRVVIRLERV
jgi:hypothetical protein